MRAHRHDAAFVVPRFALAALLAWPMAASAQSAPVPSSSTGTTEMSAMPGMDHASMPGMTMEPVEGDPVPTDARSDDYSDNIAASPAHGLHMHGSAPLGMLRMDQFETFHGRDGTGQRWEVEGWHGSDVNKLWVRSEGEHGGGKLNDGDLEVFWNRNVTAFWSTQLGVRHDMGAGPQRQWAAVGVQGVAPYWLGIEATAYVGSSGRTAARLRADYELLFTQRLILQPELEANFYGRADRARGIGSGFTDATLGLRLRYEMRREFAPYIGVVWVRQFGATADFARNGAQPVFDRRWVAGLRLWL
jgi:copper resistance protein B